MNSRRSLRPTLFGPNLGEDSSNMEHNLDSLEGDNQFGEGEME